MGLFKKKDDGFYHVDEILKHKCYYNMIFGERSAGKTYSALEYALKKHKKDGSQFAYIRRWDEEIKGKRAATIFDGIAANGVIKKLFNDEYDSIYYYSGRFYLSKYDTEKNKRINAPEPIGFAFALSTMEHDKSTSYPHINTIIFDEFMTRSTYLVDEFVVFSNVLSTIIRHRDNVEIFMLGNTVNQYCPYFKEMGLKNIKKMEPGQIDIYTYGDSKLKVAVEYTGGGKLQEKKSNFYFAFDNPKLHMITGGAWELDIYPHAPVKYRPSDIAFSYFIQFDDILLQADLITLENAFFTYIHRKTTPIKNENEDLIFCTEYKPFYNWRLRIDKPQDNLGKIIYSQFVSNRVYYQDNEVGDCVMNYLQWCEQQ